MSESNNAIQQQPSSGTNHQKSRVSRNGPKKLQKQKGYRRNKENPDGSKATESEDEDDDDQCIICANKIKYASISPCNHTTCHECTFRQRALYEKKQCLVCRSENEIVIFSHMIGKEWTDFGARDIVKSDEKYRIDFTADYVYDDTLDLLNYRCVQCSNVFSNFKSLSDHAKAEHSKYYCLICSKHKKAFISELTLYSYKQLQRHQSEGDKTGFTGHPECKHCHGKRFYSEDELNIHIRDRHERCHICDQVSPKTADYYKNYDTLYSHFKNDHYVCTVQSCVEKRFVVFREDLDLTAHMLKEHGGITGSSKLVIGSASRQFHSQLSTFNNPSSSRSHPVVEEKDSYEIKKLRFEERARHYLNYSVPNFKNFLNINNQFRSKKISAKDLLKEYKDLFTSQTPKELNLLIFELGELLQNSSELRKSLSVISTELDTAAQVEQFPLLGGLSAPASMTNLHGWGSTSPSSKNNSSMFPVLSKPSKSTAKKISNNQPIRYTTVLKKGNNYNKVTINAETAESSYRPNYLQDINKAPSTSSLPILGSSSPSPSQSPPYSASSTPKLSVAKSSNLPDSKFPALEKKTTKKVIPRVKQYNIADPASWGVQTKEEPSEAVEESFDFNKKQTKSKKRQQKLLFSNNI